MKQKLILDTILKHNLMLRKIPEKVVHRLACGKDDCYKNIIKVAFNPKLPKAIDKRIAEGHSGIVKENGIYYRFYREQVIIPEHAGHWMCKPSPSNTSSRVEWSTHTTKPFLTLEAAVINFDKESYKQ